MHPLSKILKLSSWTLSSALINLALQLILFLVVARHIVPAELGTYFIASALVFIPIGILEYSFTSSLIHKAKTEREDYQSVLSINLISALVLFVFGVIVAFGMSYYYNKQNIFRYFLMLSPVFLIWQVTSIQNTGLKKLLKFKQFSITEIFGSLTNFGIAMWMIMGGYGVESLIGGQLGKAILLLVILSVSTNFIGLSFKGIKKARAKHLNYGKYILGEKSFGVVMGYADTFLVHHFLGAEVLGIYDLLKRLIMRPLTAAYVSLEQVMFPLLSKATSVVNDYKNLFRNFTKLSSSFMLSLVLILFQDYILGFFPIEYQQQDQLFSLLIILACSLIIFNPLDIVSYSLDMTKKHFRWVMVYSIIQIVIMIISLQWSIQVMLACLIVSNLVLYLISYQVLLAKDDRMSMIDWARPVHFFLLMVLLVVVLQSSELSIVVSTISFFTIFFILHRLIYSQIQNTF